MENSLFQNVYNPDVLSCIANLSNDEVFTPPELANKIIDMLPQELFENPDTTFLDPCCKSGVFLREIAKRLIKGLKKQIPDLEKRIEHIFSKQLFGIAITELTSLLSRRSVYCSKYPSGEFSVYQFPEEKPQGNIIFQGIRHTWKDGKCIYCGASQNEYDRETELEAHAYQFIHNLDVHKVFNMKFDVIIGNPPYQMNDGGGEGSSATPIYDKFVKNAIKLNPRYLTMIIPARWYSGGKGLDSFRDEMLNDRHLRIIHDFPETSDCFPGINIRGGVCYFLWDRNQKGDCLIYNHKGNIVTSFIERPLLEGNSTTFIRYNEAISILNKVRSFKEETMDNRVQSRLPFGIPSNFENYELTKSSKANITLFRSDRSKSSHKQVFIEPRYITKNIAWKDKKKVLVSKASPGGDEYPHGIISTPLYADVNTVCTETYLIVDFVNNKIEGQNLISYMTTRFFRFMMSLIKNTQNISKGVFAFVPVQDYSKSWTDEELYAKYGLTKEEIAFIESMIRPMK
jgi:site-specific DNA-methyltransferase (adenine-specific)